MSLFKRLLLLFIIIPLFEIYLFITVGSLIGVWPTVLLVILTAIIGTYLLRAQGLATLQKMQAPLDQGVMPTEALIEGILLLLGGALLLTPGFFTDMVGLVCLVPGLRKYLLSWLGQHVQPLPSSPSEPRPQRRRRRSSSSTTIEGEYRREDD